MKALWMNEICVVTNTEYNCVVSDMKDMNFCKALEHF